MGPHAPPAATTPPSSTATAPTNWLLSTPAENASSTHRRSPSPRAAASAAGSDVAVTGTSAANREFSTAPSTATPSPLPNSASVPLTPAPTPALAGGIALISAWAMAGLPSAQPTPISSSPSSVPA